MRSNLLCLGCGKRYYSSSPEIKATDECESCGSALIVTDPTPENVPPVANSAYKHGPPDG